MHGIPLTGGIKATSISNFIHSCYKLSLSMFLLSRNMKMICHYLQDLYFLTLVVLCCGILSVLFFYKKPF